MRISPFPPLFSCALFIVFYACSPAKKKSELKWSRDLPQIGSQSSPRATDLNNDGVLDIIMGAGKNEYQESDFGIVAFDGKTGSLLWKQKSGDQVYGTPTLMDVNGDKVKDVFIGGRSPQLKALDGKTGAVIWEFKPEEYRHDSIMKLAVYNFNNCLLVADQNGDGIEDLLTVNGGNSYAAPFSTENRFPAVLMLLDSKTGAVIAADTMPDGKESYMSPLVFSRPDSKELFIVFGTGGETIDGSLYVATMDQLRARKLSEARKIAEEKRHGFIAPPSFADINKDGFTDIIVISHGSKAMAINGKDYSTLWSKTFPGTECSNSFAVGDYNGDDTPDFFTFISKGEWPNNSGSVELMLNGKNGEIEYLDSMGCTGFSSPVVYDLNNDGRDDAIISINEYDCALGYDSLSPRNMETRLLVIDFAKKKTNTIDQAKGFKNVFTTPWIGDLDGDGYLDLVHCQYYHHSNIITFLGMRTKRIDLPIKIRKEIRWGEYLGSRGNGHYDEVSGER